MAFLDPPKATAAAAIHVLQQHGVAVKVVTGDNDLVARGICTEVGVPFEHVLLGAEVEQMTDEQLATAAEQAALFARVSPAHKQRIINALQVCKHTVGFMRNGINNACMRQRFVLMRAVWIGQVSRAAEASLEDPKIVLINVSVAVEIRRDDALTIDGGRTASGQTVGKV